MREIKFRALDKIKNQMSEVRAIDWLNGMVEMQYTGIRDKNGKEIYEGDILSGIAFYNGNDYGGEGQRKNITYIKTWNFLRGVICGGFALNEISRYMEVIGNIYENPELMRREKE